MGDSNEKYEIAKNELKREIYRTGTQVIEMMWMSMDSLFNKDNEKRQIVIKRYSKIKKMQYSVEEKVALLVAEHRPDVKDLREIISAIRFIVHLERIAARCRHIASTNISFPIKDLKEDFNKIRKMMENSISLFLQVLESYKNDDIKEAKKILFKDLQIISSYKRFNIRLASKLKKHPELTDEYIKLINLNRDIERLASHIMSISSWIYYIITGEQVEISNSALDDDD